jgi:hypothetical protein
MRTTLTLDPDVAAELERRRTAGRNSLKGDVNRLLRLGLQAERSAEGEAPTERFRVKPWPVGEILIDIDDVSAALDVIDPPRL